MQFSATENLATLQCLRQK